MLFKCNGSVCILFLGATGYIGGSVLGRLLQHPARTLWEIVSYLRNEEKAKILKEWFRVKSIIGSLDESQKIEDAAASADIVIHTAESADHIASAQAILKGLKRKHVESSKVPIYIHTVSNISFSISTVHPMTLI
jgi:nucleoside-diphosphate-sugar epimerase